MTMVNIRGTLSSPSITCPIGAAHRGSASSSAWASNRSSAFGFSDAGVPTAPGVVEPNPGDNFLVQFVNGHSRWSDDGLANYGHALTSALGWAASVSRLPL